MLFDKLTTNSPCPTSQTRFKTPLTRLAYTPSLQRRKETNMTLYFRWYRICYPLKPHSMGYLEAILAAEAAERKKKEKAAKRKEEHRVMLPL
jgi:hypothetical protein